MPKVTSAGRATETAKDFLRSLGYYWLEPQRAWQEEEEVAGKVWVVVINAGFLGAYKATVKLSAETGEVVEYDVSK